MFRDLFFEERKRVTERIIDEIKGRMMVLDKPKCKDTEWRWKELDQRAIRSEYHLSVRPLSYLSGDTAENKRP